MRNWWQRQDWLVKASVIVLVLAATGQWLNFTIVVIPFFIALGVLVGLWVLAYPPLFTALVRWSRRVGWAWFTAIVLALLAISISGYAHWFASEALPMAWGVALMGGFALVQYPPMARAFERWVEREARPDIDILPPESEAPPER